MVEEVRILPVLTCGWTKYARPTLKLLEQEFEILDPIIAEIPGLLIMYY